MGPQAQTLRRERVVQIATDHGEKIWPRMADLHFCPHVPLCIPVQASCCDRVGVL